jgi:DNA-binding transcriptional ArsR family regulator
MTPRSAAERRDTFEALADPTRRRLLDLLTKGDLPVNELARRFDVTRPAISQHLRVLRDADLVRETRVGRERRYRLHARRLRTVHDWVSKYEVFWDAKLAALGEVLDREDL